MRLVFGKAPLRRILKWTQRALFASAFLLLGYCGFALVDAWIFQARESGNLDRPLHDRRPASEAPPQPQSSTSPKSAPAALTDVTDGLIGRIEIPRLPLSVVVVEGIDKTTLRRAVGHIPGTALPGEAGNVGLAGRRGRSKEAVVDGDGIFFWAPVREVKDRKSTRLNSSHLGISYAVFC